MRFYRRTYGLSCVLLLLTATACRSQDQPGREGGADSVMVAPPVDPLAAMVDSGAVAMPEPRRRFLLEQDSLWAEALRIHYNALVVDGHIDTPLLMLDEGYRFGTRHRSYESHVDLPRMFDGGLDAAFFSIYVAPPYGEGERATERARMMMAEVKRQVAAHADSVALATSAAAVRRLTKAGKKAVLMGLEGGHALAASPDVLRALYDEGIRYVTLTHINTNAWADASQALPRWNGLNDLGRRLVQEMNRLGMLVDLAHVSDATFYDALAVSQAPVLVSHSSMRALTPSVRNLDDAMLRALAQNGGVVMINFFDAMVNPHLDASVMAEVYRRLPEAQRYNLWNVVYAVKRERGLPGATLDDVLDHLDHAVSVAGIDHVGLGSDFDGVFDLPAGLEDVTRLPHVTYGLLRRGYSEEAIYKILGGNVLRVLEEAERVAATLRP
ncbi:MAG: dipeptidase [Rhodothermales bacterium]